MTPGKNIRLLVVDDSILFREVLSKGISADPGIEVVATANDPFDARDKIIKYMPDVMTCDVEMPRMNGIEFIRRLIPKYPIPVIVVSSVSGAVFDAIKAGAVDFVTKPDVNSVDSVKSFVAEMIEKVKIASLAKVVPSKTEGRVRKIGKNGKGGRKRIIAIGASTGDIEAINKIIRELPEDTPGIVLVQHIPPVFSRMFAERLNSISALNVREAETGDLVGPGQVLVAPGDKHMKIVKMGDYYKVLCFEDKKVNGHRPSVDVLFESVAKEAGSNSVGVILTGMGYDGAKGLLLMRKVGARTIGQDEHSCVVYGMPKVAYNIGAVEKQAPLDNIANLIYKLSG